MENCEDTANMDESELDESDPLDVLDTTKYIPATRQLINCVICDQKFTNKVIPNECFS